MTILPLAKRLACALPVGTQEGLKCRLDSWRIARGTFVSTEPEFRHLCDWIEPGDTVLDIGANTGVYTLAMAKLAERVIAFEPVPRSFRLLARNTAGRENVTLVNAAVSDRTGERCMALANYYRAAIAAYGVPVFAVALDGLNLPPVSLVKIDVEGHEFEALTGMRSLLERDKPVLIVEGDDPRVRSLLLTLDYTQTKYARSPNSVFT